MKKINSQNTDKQEELILGALDLEEFYDNGIGYLAKEYLISFQDMKDFVQCTMEPFILEKERLKVGVLKFLQEYEILVMELVKKINTTYIGPKQIEAFVDYIENLELTELKNLNDKSMDDIVIFLNLLPEPGNDLKSLPKDEQEFFDDFSNSLFE